MEGFFLVCSQINPIELKEILLRKYGRYDFPEMDFNEFIEFIVLAITKEKEDKIRGVYNALLPYYANMGIYMPFEEFYDKFTGANIDLRPADEILNEAEEIRARFGHGN